MKTNNKQRNNEKLRAKNEKYVFSLFTLLFSFLSFAQSLTSSENYVYTKVYLSADGSKKSETVQYFDGLGRPKQVVQIKATPLGQDLVVPVEYDQFGRESRKILPIPAATGNGAIHGSVSQTAVNAYYGVANAYSEQKIEASPLARVQETAHPGTEWAMATGHTVKMEYLTNTTSDQVKKYNTTTSWSSGTLTTSISGIALYSPNQLSKSKVTDEDGNVTLDFKNSEGKTVLLRKEGASGKLDTYYVYNNYGQLAFVISPKGNEKITANNNVVTPQILNDLCYQYVYDNRFRQVEKKLPGKGWEYMVYDLQNRLVATQDANMRNNSQNPNRWLFTRYDKFGRVVYTGVFTGGSRLQEQTNANAKGLNNESRSPSSFSLSGQQIFYTNTAYPATAFVPYSVNYYDTYPSVPGNTVSTPTDILAQTTLSGTVNVTSNGVSSIRSLKSMATASMVKNLEDDAWSSTQIWYDRLGRTIGSYGKNHLGGYTKTEKQLDFSGAVLFANTYHRKTAAEPSEVIINERFVYDNNFRLKQHYHKVNTNAEELLADYTYNELGQVTNKKVGNNLQSIDYAYNIRGTLTKVNNPANLGTDLFAYELKFHNPSNPAFARYNGNISEIDWKKSSMISGTALRRYRFTYDDFNRLSEAKFSEPQSVVPVNSLYDENVEYDANGNITSLKRDAPLYNTANQIDDLVYEYSGNRLIYVDDKSGNTTGYEGGAGTIEYDDNGNMVTMPDKMMDQIQYNILDLPMQININDNHKKINYFYRADGTKIRKNYLSTDKDTKMYASSTEYIDGFHYATDSGDKLWEMFQNTGGSAYETEAFTEFVEAYNYINVLKFVPTAEGFFDFQNNQYIYQYKDHLGNVRLSYKKEGNSIAVTDSNDYYPFGMNFVRNEEEEAHFGIGSYVNYKYNGKELQETGMYDYGARFYMPDIGRWGVIDPLAEMYTRHSPYHYAVNNPMRFIDPDGRSSQTFEGQDAQSVYWYFYFHGSVNNFNGNDFSSLGGGSNQSSNLSASFNYIDAGGSGGGGGGSSLSPWMQSYLGGGYQPLTKEIYAQYILGKGRGLTGGDHNFLGYLFEDVFIRWGKINIGNGFQKNETKYINTIPDSVEAFSRSKEIILFPFSTINAYNFYEVKLTYGNIGMGTAQLSREVLSLRNTNVRLGVPDESYVGNMYVVTPYDVNITTGLKAFAEFNHVDLIQYRAVYQMIKGSMFINFVLDGRSIQNASNNTPVPVYKTPN
ncbi:MULTISPECIES: DUF6443 domain-containing protein [Chryseobacterium]|uniref:RHS repeat-associated core domain n=1 Tax=Chryseobacterium taihuense TaxID=1141221 RepID=A0A4U8WDG8_9FLAO|nr:MULTISPECIES: DUF6443 domain-containing protein [Chryseobacterium]QQV03069.1 RHS repeat-associated core domain-containing protein [Chryseobacterium sp. FDAARGOS 1104]VFB03636.1 RHS repeat-associated core domain [Chryseobacterium taihuense]